MKKIFTILLFNLALITIQAQENKFNLIVGTYTNTCDSNGIYVYEFDSNTGDFNFKNETDKTINPSFLSVSDDNKFIYSVNENGDKSAVSAFAYSPKSGKLDFINSEKTNGSDSCYIIDDEKNIIVANYSSGNITVLGKRGSGGITEIKQIVQHTGKGINKKRQEAPHAHQVYYSPDKKYVLSNDLGTDKVYVYEYNPNSANTILVLKSSVDVESGSGPRHLVFSEDGKYVYVLQELDGTLTSFSNIPLV